MIVLRYKNSHPIHVESIIPNISLSFFMKGESHVGVKQRNTKVALGEDLCTKHLQHGKEQGLYGEKRSREEAWKETVVATSQQAMWGREALKVLANCAIRRYCDI